MSIYQPLSPPYYTQPTLTVAQALLGKIVVRRLGNTTLAGKIVETEGYIASIDAACHAYTGQTPRNRSMFAGAGTVYVYVSYGMHMMLNIVTEPAGIAAAVLIRALEPVEGIETMRRHRFPPLTLGKNTPSLTAIANGPGNLTKAFGIDRRSDGVSLPSPDFFIADAEPVSGITVTTRVGITKGIELPWRYLITGNRFVSKGKPSGSMVLKVGADAAASG